MSSIDPVIHAALVTLFAWLVQLLFSMLGLDLGSETATSLAQVIVAYILSLFGLGLFYKATTKTGVVGEGRYKPPFTS